MASNYVDIVEWNLIKILNKKNRISYKLVVILPEFPKIIFSPLIKSIIDDNVTVLFTDIEDNTYKCLIRRYNENIAASEELVTAININNPEYVFSILASNTEFGDLEIKTPGQIKVTKI